MKSHLYHLQINIDFSKNSQFYKSLMEFLGWSVIFEGEDMIGYKSGLAGDLWFIDSQKKEISDYDKFGVNHISLRIENQNDIDKIVEFLKTKNTEPLFETPRHRPEFVSEENQTYYQVIFESPDKIQFEIVYIGEKI